MKYLLRSEFGLLLLRTQSVCVCRVCVCVYVYVYVYVCSFNIFIININRSSMKIIYTKQKYFFLFYVFACVTIKTSRRSQYTNSQIQLSPLINLLFANTRFILTVHPPPCLSIKALGGSRALQCDCTTLEPWTLSQSELDARRIGTCTLGTMITRNDFHNQQVVPFNGYDSPWQFVAR